MDLEKLKQKHKEVPPDYYERGISENYFQRLWHGKRFKVILKNMPEIKNKFYLDVGCDGGLLMRAVADKLGAGSSYGIDISAESIAYAQKKYPQFHFQAADCLNLPFKKDFFDFITCFEVIEHVAKPEMALEEMKRCLKKGGELMLLVPTESLFFRFIWFFWTRLGRGKVWRETHINKIKSRNLAPLLEKMGFGIIKRQKSHFGMLLALRARLINK